MLQDFTKSIFNMYTSGFRQQSVWSFFFLLFALFSTSLMAQDNDRDLPGRVAEAKKILLEKDPGLIKFFSKSYGYALFPSIGKGGMGIGGAHGRGLVYQGGSTTGRSSMTQATIGLQLGGQSYIEVLFFEDKRAYEHFIGGKFKLAAQASAVAVNEGASADAGYNDGVAIFTATKGGLMFEASVGGQKFTFKK